jgi:hypothetical protein
MTIHVPSSTALALGASSIMFATVMTDISDEHYTSSSFVSFYGLVGVGLTPPVVFALPARMDDPDWLPCRVGASSYLPDGGCVAGRSVRRGMIVFLARCCKCQKFEELPRTKEELGGSSCPFTQRG